MLAVYKEWQVCRDHMPKKSRYTLGERIDARFLQALELMYCASYQPPKEKLATLTKALVVIDTLKFLLRIAWEVRALDEKKYLGLSKTVDEAGRQAGGWRKGIQTKTSARSATEETR